MPTLAGVLLALFAIFILDARGAHAQTTNPPTTTVCSPANGITFTLKSSPVIYQDYDKTPQITNNYIHFVITNTSPYTIESVQMGITSTTPISRAQFEDGMYDVKLAPGQSTSVYYYVWTTAAPSDLFGQVWLTPWTGDASNASPPTGTGTPICRHVQPLTIHDTAENNSNKVNTVTTTDLSNGCFRLSVAGQTGNTNNGVNMMWSYTPATVQSWPADLLNLTGINTVITPTGGMRTYTNTLFITDVPEAGGTGWPYVINYTFCLGEVNAPIPSIPINPASFINTSSDLTHNGVGSGDFTLSYRLLLAFKNDNGVTAAAGDRVVYTITVQNAGTLSATNVIVSDTVPANTRFSSSGSSANWSPSCADNAAAGSVCSFTIPTVNAGQLLTYTFAVTVDQNAPTSVTTVTNTVVGLPSTIRDTETTPVIRQATVGITKTNGLSSVLTGQPLTYTIVVTNAGPSALQNAVISDIIPSALTGANWTATTLNATTSPASGTGNISATTTISSGGRITYTLLATVTSGATGIVTNTARILPPSGITLTNSITQATDADPVLLSANLAITKTAYPTPTVIAGNLLTYTVVAGNSGPSNIVGAIISDTLPGALSGQQWTCAAGVGANCNAASGSGSLNNISVTLAAGSQLTFTITGTVNAGATGSIANTATITVPAGAVDGVPPNNTSTVNTTISAQADVKVTKFGPASAIPGDAITYTILVTNSGPSVAPSVNVSDIVPATIPNVIWTCTIGASPCATASGSGSINTNVALNVNDVAKFVLTGTINAAATGTLANTASITTPIDTNAGNNSSTVNTTLTPSADVAINKAGPVTVTIGRPVVYTLTVTNLGKSVAKDITVTDNTPAGLTFTGFGGACSGATCNIASLGVTSNATVLVSFTIPSNYTGTPSITNTASVTASTSDPNLQNNTSTFTTTPEALADVGIRKTASSNSVTAGTQVTYTIVVSNAGPSDASNVTLGDQPLPIPFSPVVVSGACSAFPCVVGDIPINETRTITAVYLAPSGFLTTPVTNRATASSPTPDANQTNNVSNATVTISTSADVSITKQGPAVIVPGTNAVFTLTVKNLGPSDALTVTVNDPGFDGLTPNSTSPNCAGFPCNLGTLTLNSQAVITMSFSVPANFTPTQVTNPATVTSATDDPQPNNNEDSVTVPVTRIVDLDITKQAPATAIAGTQLTYTLIVTNNGPSEATNVTVSDTVPANLTYASGSAGCSVGTGLLSCTAASLAPNASKTFTATFDIASSATGDIGNTAAVTSTETPTETTSTVTTTLSAMADLNLTKSGPAQATPGKNIQYTIVVSNPGPSDVATGIVSDVLPSALNAGSVSWMCSGANGATCPPAGAGSLNETVSLPANSTVVFTVTGTISDTATGTISNTASVTPTSATDPNPQDNEDTVETVLIPEVNLDIVKDAPATAIAGEQLTYTIQVTNSGPSQATNVTVSDTVPAGLTFYSGANCAVNAGVLSCDAGTLAVGASKTFTVVFDIAPSATGDIGNTAAVTSTETPTETTSTVTTTLQSVTHLSITKDAPATAIAGEQLTYTIVVTNNGPSEATNVMVSDTVPADLAFVSGTAGCAVNGGMLTCSAGTLAPNASATFTATFNINPDARNDIGNTAAVTSTQNLTETTDTVTTTLNAMTNLSITKDAPASAVAGAQLTYTLIVTNNGPSTANNVAVSDTVPANLTYVPASSSCTVSGGVLSCNAGTLAVGGSAMFKPAFNIAASATGEIGNTAAVTSTENLTETSDSVTTTLTSVAVLSITKDAPATATAGEQLTYTIVVTNHGPSQATNVTVSDTVPAGLTYTNNEGSCTVSSGVLSCNAGTLAVGASAAFKPTFDIGRDVRGEIGNTAAVTSTETPTETTSTVTTTVTAVTNLSISKAGPASAVAGGQVAYTIVVTNNGPSNATNVTITDPDPENLTVTGSPCVAPCSVGGLKVGESYTLTLTFNINPFATGSVTNTASVTSTEAPTATSASAPTSLLVQADLAISKTDGQDSSHFGAPITYTIVVTNNGPSGVIEAVVSDTLPAEVTNATWTCTAVAPNTCAPANGTGSPVSPLVKLAPNSTVIVTVNGVLATDGERFEVSNSASIAPPPGATDPITDNNTSTDTTYLTYLVDAIVTKTVEPANAVAPGQLFTYVVSIGNAGPSTAIDAIVDDTLPAQMVNPQWTCEATAGSLCDSPSTGVGSIAGQQVTIQPGGLVTYVITGTASTQSASGDIVNTANVTFDNEVVEDSNPLNNTSVVTVPLVSNAFVSIGKTNGQTIAVPGAALTYVITLANQGPSDAYGTLFDIYPLELSSANWQSAGANGALVLDPLVNITTPPGVWVKLPAGSVLTVTGSASVNITATGWLTNVAQFTMGENIVANNPVTQAVDVDEIVPAVVKGMIFSDLNGNGVLDAAEPGLPGVRVVITPTGASATEVTADANGAFSLVAPPGTFGVSVVQASVPAGYALTSANDAQIGVAVAGANATAPIGYQARGSVGGVAFNDINGNGTRDGGESGLSNVVVSLAADAVQPTSAQATITTTTDAGGNYSFANVAAGAWLVSAATPAGFVNTTPTQQNVTVSANANQLADFGFQRPGAVIITKAGQTSGKSNQLGADRLITYTLVVTNTGGAPLSNVLVTDTLPSYLQYIEDSATPEPMSAAPLVWQIADMIPGQGVTIRFTVKVDASFNSAVHNIAFADSQVEPPTPSNEVVINPAPTAITLLSFTAQRDAGGVNVVWVTGMERDTFGFNMLRSETGNRADAVQVNTTLIPAGAKDGRYTFVDAGADAGKTYTYWLQEIEVGGKVNDYPDTATVQPASGQGLTRFNVFIPMVMR